MALLTPAYRLTFRDGGGAAASSSLGGALGNVTGGSGSVIDTTSDAQASTITELTVELGMAGAADRLTLSLGQVGSFRPAVDQHVDVELGYVDADSLEPVVKATIVESDPGLVQRRVVAHSSARALQRTRLDRTFEQKTAGDIVEELAAEADVEVATADAGSRFPAYVVDGRRDAYAHIGQLAELCGFDRYVDRDGKLVFAFFTGGRTTHVFEHGRHILELELEERPAVATRVDAFGESPGAQRGDDSWAWLTKDFGALAGTAGDGTPVRLLERSVLRTGQSAQRAADAAFTELERRRRRGYVLVLGAPQVRLGDSLRISGAPEPGLDAIYQVRSITHRIDKHDGFTTRIQFRSIEG